MSMDPSDDCTFWYTNEYYASSSSGSSGNWHTWISAFRFSACYPNALVKRISTSGLYPGIAAAYGTIISNYAVDIQTITFY